MLETHIITRNLQHSFLSSAWQSHEYYFR